MSDVRQVAAGVNEGDVLAGKYRVDKVLGVGGMGVVVAAHHVQLDDRVAIKFMLPEALANRDAVARFTREARAAVRIKSEHVARVTDVGTLENGAPYMVMEYLEGSDLSGWLSQRGALPVDQAVEFVLQAGEALAEAHALEIVHRDLKPANLFVVKRPDKDLSVKVLDFGISKVTGFGGSGADGAMTRTSAMMGSPLYMSPEQMTSSKDVDARSDIWALGVILYELITGVTPFLADSLPELALKIMSAPPPSMRELRPDVPDGLEAVILRCLDKDRGRRFETVGALALMLLPFGSKRSRMSVERISGVMRAAGIGGTALALPPSSDSATPPAAASATAGTFGRTTAGRSRTSTAALIGAVALVALGLAALGLRSKGANADATPTTAAAAATTSPTTPPTVANAATTSASPSGVAAASAPAVPVHRAPPSSAPPPVPSPERSATPERPAQPTPPARNEMSHPQKTRASSAAPQPTLPKASARTHGSDDGLGGQL